MKDFDKRNVPNYLIILSLIIIFPLGMYFLVLKAENNLHDLKRNSNILRICGYVSIIVLIVYFFVNYSAYLSLIDSHMSLDMYSFNFLYFYFYILILTISLLYGGRYLKNKCDKLVIYTEFINIRHIKDINLIAEETMESLDEVKENINKLIKKGYLYNVVLENNRIISRRKNSNKKLVKCKSCGNVRKLDKEVVHCDFCYRKMDKDDLI